MTPRTVVSAVGVVLALAPGAATANDGALYPYGASVWATSPQFSATVLGGPVWQIQAPALAPAAAVNAWEMNWSCPVPGSEIAHVRFGALRTQAPSSLALRVTGDRQSLWEEGDVGIPLSPAGGRAYDVGLPPGQCNVHIALSQVEARNQHARGYFIDNPRILVRDLTAPTVALRALSTGWLRAGAQARVDWAVSDNFGGDGVAAQRVIVGGQVRWSGAPGVGNHGLDLPLDGVADGAVGVEVHADGDGTPAGTAGGVVHVDRTPPVAVSLAAAGGGRPGLLAFSWVAGDATSGVAASTVEVNTATDGGTAGAWQTLASTAGPGPHAVTAAAVGIPDGVHAWRVRATDVAGNVSHRDGPGTVTVDTTPPRLELHGLPAGWVARAEVDLTATDELEPVLGPVVVEIDVNTAPDGGEGGDWQRRATSTGPVGRRLVPVDLSGLAPGRHAVRITARDGGAPGLATERRATIRVDTQPPTVARAAFSGGDGRPVTATWVAEDAHAGVATATVQWRDGGAWRALGTAAATDGAGSMVVDASSLPPGERPMRVVVGDAAGNTATRAGTVAVGSGGGVGSSAADPVERLRTARLALSVVGARAERRGGRRLLVRRIAAGGTVVIRGRLRDHAARPVVGAGVQARGHRGRLVGRALTGRGGRFTLRARPAAGAVLRIGVPAGGRLLPERTPVGVRVEVRPRVALTASRTTVAMGERVLFSGRIHPAPRSIGLGSRKGLVLEWLDPIRRSWRPVVNGRVRRDGTFAVPWTFGLRGLTIPMRVTVPQEVGWPLLPVRSRVIRVTIGG